MNPLTWLVAALACYRATLLVTSDEVTRPAREHATRRLRQEGKIAYLITCPWCVSVYLAPIAIGTALAWSNGWGWWLVCGSLAASAATGYLATYAAPET